MDVNLEGILQGPAGQGPDSRDSPPGPHRHIAAAGHAAQAQTDATTTWGHRKALAHEQVQLAAHRQQRARTAWTLGPLASLTGLAAGCPHAVTRGAQCPPVGRAWCVRLEGVGVGAGTAHSYAC